MTSAFVTLQHPNFTGCVLLPPCQHGPSHASGFENGFTEIDRVSRQVIALSLTLYTMSMTMSSFMTGTALNSKPVVGAGNATVCRASPNMFPRLL